MATTTTISQKELKRQAGLVFEGKTLYVMLCSVGATGYTSESTVANWQSVEKSGNGYARYSSGTIPVGAYDATTGTYKLPDIDAAFTATGAGYSYDRVVLYISGETYIHSLIAEDPNITLSAGQTQTYRLSLRQDD
jgi:hypothetical protein